MRPARAIRLARPLRWHDEGVITGICPDATLVDITHDVTAARRHGRCAATCRVVSLFPGRYDLPRRSSIPASGRRDAAWRPRRATSGSWRPTTACCPPFFARRPPQRVVELTERRYARPTVTRTFEGRDRFAPAAAWLAKGTQLTAFGRTVSDYHRLEIPIAEAARRRAARRRPARRSLRQSGHQHRSPHVRGLREACADPHPGAGDVRRAAGLDVCGNRGRRNLRAVRELGSSRARGELGQRGNPVGHGPRGDRRNQEVRRAGGVSFVGDNEDSRNEATKLPEATKNTTIFLSSSRALRWPRCFVSKTFVASASSSSSIGRS